MFPHALLSTWTALRMMSTLPLASVQSIPAFMSHAATATVATATMPSGSKVYGIRDFPYPYDAMLAISSDADHETVRKFELVHQFLNTREQTPMGKGLGLDVSDSVFMYNGSNIPGYIDIRHTPLSDEMSYFVGTSLRLKDAKQINAWIHQGWIDTLHSYGDFSRVNQRQTTFTRRLAMQAVDALKRNGEFLSVWTDHGNMSNVDNFGRHGTAPFYNYQQGAQPRSSYFHTDVTIPYGIHFVWTDGHSDVFGHKSMIYPVHLGDGQRVWGFHRYTNAGVTKNHRIEWVWSQDYMSQELTSANLAAIIRNHEYSIVAQHFEADNTTLPFSQSSIEALRHVAQLQNEGKLLVAGTARLLQYNVSRQYVAYRVFERDGKTVIDITAVKDPVFGTKPATLADVRGLTFYVSNPSNTEIELSGRPVPIHLVQHHSSDGKHASVEVKWWTA